MEGVWDPLSIPLEQRGAAMGASGVCARGAEERVGGWGSLFLGGRDKKGGVDAALPAQFRRGCPSDVPLGFRTGHGERGDKGERGKEQEEEERPCLTPSLLEMPPTSTITTTSTHQSSPLLQSGHLLDPRRLLLCILIPHYNNLEREQRTESD